LHPNDAPRRAAAGELEAAWAEIEELAADDAVRAVGETGLDHFRTGPDGREAQEYSFRAHIEMARRQVKVVLGGDGMPVALQVVAARHDDDLCLGAGALMERVRPWPKFAPLAYE
jgi:Tat protein secretion system quality control protein TatD with DNase activity